MHDEGVMLRDATRPLTPRRRTPTTYYASLGPADGPMEFCQQPPKIGVFARNCSSPRGAYPIGTAYSVGWARYKGAIAGAFRLVIGREEVAGRWVCDRRRFVPIDGPTA